MILRKHMKVAGRVEALLKRHVEFNGSEGGEEQIPEPSGLARFDCDIQNVSFVAFSKHPNIT
jgi:hypothetical protein